KEAGLIDSGGAAKWYLGENSVTVNGAAEERRGRKLYPDDQVSVAGQTYVIVSV
ncbi:MAG: RNA-binding S4 domain-containing protein, partial [Lacticaseibacillus paracasei]